MATAGTLRRTPLYERHVAAGARLVPFAGWEMPVQYEGIRPEHVAVRIVSAASTHEVTAASAGAARHCPGASTNTTVAPCCWRSHVNGPAGPTPIAAASTRSPW